MTNRRPSVRCRVAVRAALIGALWSLCLASGCTREGTRDEPRLWTKDAGHWYTVRLTGHDFTWQIRYPGADGELGTEDDIQTRHHLFLPADTKVRLQLTSDDYIYTLTLPDWNRKEIAVPDLMFQLEFQTDRIGQFDLRGDQMCGYAHADLLGRLIVLSHDDFNAWLRQRQRAIGSPGETDHESL